MLNLVSDWEVTRAPSNRANQYFKSSVFYDRWELYNKVFHNDDVTDDDDEDTDDDDDDDKRSFFGSLKGLCHEDIAILGQFSA